MENLFTFDTFSNSLLSTSFLEAFSGDICTTGGVETTLTNFLHFMIGFQVEGSLESSLRNGLAERQKLSPNFLVEKSIVKNSWILI